MSLQSALISLPLANVQNAPLRHPVRVFRKDIDVGTTMFHGGFVTFMERARTNWLPACPHPEGERTLRAGRVPERTPAVLPAPLPTTKVHLT
jgi:hypothetical protein